MIKSVGIDLAGAGEHKVRCLDEEAQLCDGFGFETSPEGLAKLEERVFRDGVMPNRILFYLIAAVTRGICMLYLTNLIYKEREYAIYNDRGRRR